MLRNNFHYQHWWLSSLFLWNKNSMVLSAKDVWKHLKIFELTLLMRHRHNNNKSCVAKYFLSSYFLYWTFSSLFFVSFVCLLQNKVVLPWSNDKTCCLMISILQYYLPLVGKNFLYSRHPSIKNILNWRLVNNLIFLNHSGSVIGTNRIKRFFRRQIIIRVLWFCR